MVVSGEVVVGKSSSSVEEVVSGRLVVASVGEFVTKGDSVEEEEEAVVVVGVKLVVSIVGATEGTAVVLVSIVVGAVVEGEMLGVVVGNAEGPALGNEEGILVVGEMLGVIEGTVVGVVVEALGLYTLRALHKLFLVVPEFVRLVSSSEFNHSLLFDASALK